MNREDVVNALFDLLQSIPGIRTFSRRLRLFDDVGSSERPALFLMEHKETVVRKGQALPRMLTMELMIFVYIDSGKDRNNIPAVELNTIIESIETILRPIPGTEQTLGGLVDYCRIDGDIIKDPGDLDGDGMAMIPIKILVP